MSEPRWQKLQDLFLKAIEKPQAERAEFLAAACGDDRALREQLDAMLASEDSANEALTNIVASVLPEALGDTTPERRGQRLGPYEIRSRIAQGGMGAVYLAERADGAFEQTVAIKILAGGLTGDQAAQRFRNERQILARLNHPNIAHLLDGGTTPDNLPYLVMEHVDGLDLLTWCNEQRLPIQDRLRVFRTICSAVQFAHQNLIVHRDLKPSNILVSNEGEVKLLDFGIARLLAPDADAAEPLTRADQRLMTPEYASPEQVRGEAVTTATDVYSLGVLLYRLLGGRAPYDLADTGPHELPRIICETEPTRPSTAVRGDRDVAGQRRTTPERLERQLRGDLDTIVLKALRKEPERRYATVAAFGEDVQRYLDGLPVHARPDTWSYRALRFAQRHRWGMGSTAAAVVAAVSFGLFHTAQLTAERDRATLEARKAEQVAEFVKGLFNVSDPGQSLGTTVTARELLEQGAATVTSELTDQPLVQATMMHTIGDVYARLGLYDEAEPLLRQALDLRVEQLGDDAREVAISLRRLAWVVYLGGQLDEAESLYRRALTLDRKLLGDTHVEIARSLDRLGHALYGKGDYDAAEALYTEALAVHRALAEPDNEAFAKTLHDLGQVRQLKGDLHEAEVLFQEALEINQAHQGASHPHTLTCLHDLAVVLAAQRKFDEAERRYREALDLSVDVLGPDHPDVGITMTNFGRLYHEQGKFEAAETLYRSALAISTARNGPDHAYVAYDVVNLASLLTDQAELDQAEAEFNRALGIYAAALPPEHPYIAAALTAYARLLLLKDRPQEAEAALARALAICAEALPPDHWLAAAGRSLRGEVLIASAQYADAEALLLDSYPALRDTRGKRDARTRRALARLVKLYRAWGKPAEAAEYAALLAES